MLRCGEPGGWFGEWGVQLAALEGEDVWNGGRRGDRCAEESVFAAGFGTPGVCWDRGVVFGGDEGVGPLVVAEVGDRGG